MPPAGPCENAPMARRRPAELVRPSIRRLDGYVPGEQPGRARLIKLNTNENPYPPSPKVSEATRDAVDDRLRLYPDPTASRLRAGLARLHGCAPENILVGNGSDELLAVCIRACVEPVRSVAATRRRAATVQYFDPSYSLYPVLATPMARCAPRCRLRPTSRSRRSTRAGSQRRALARHYPERSQRPRLLDAGARQALPGD